MESQPSRTDPRVFRTRQLIKNAFVQLLQEVDLSVIRDLFEKIEHDPQLPTSRIPTDITVWYFSSALIGTMIAWLQNDMPYTPVFLAKQFSLLINK